MTRIGPTRTRILLAVIAGHERGMPPTVRELCRLTGRAKNGIHQHLNALVREGLIRRDAKTARGLVPLCRFVGVGELNSNGE